MGCPAFFFHIQHPDVPLILDDDGLDLDDYDAAKNEAVLSVREIAADVVRRGGRVTGIAIQIADETGAILGSVQARETFE
jgi:hypothetical protein